MLPHVQDTIDRLELAIASLKDGSIKHAKDHLIAACNNAKQIKEPQPIYEVTLQWSNLCDAQSFLMLRTVNWRDTQPMSVSPVKVINVEKPNE